RQVEEGENVEPGQQHHQSNPRTLAASSGDLEAPDDVDDEIHRRQHDGEEPPWAYPRGAQQRNVLEYREPDQSHGLLAHFSTNEPTAIAEEEIDQKHRSQGAVDYLGFELLEQFLAFPHVVLIEFLILGVELDVLQGGNHPSRGVCQRRIRQSIAELKLSGLVEFLDLDAGHAAGMLHKKILLRLVHDLHVGVSHGTDLEYGKSFGRRLR